MVAFSNEDNVNSSSCAQMRRFVVDVVSCNRIGLDYFRAGNHAAGLEQLQSALATARKISQADPILLEIAFHGILISPCHVDIGLLPLDHNTFILNTVFFSMRWGPSNGTAGSICQPRDFFAVVLYNLGYAFHISSLQNAANSGVHTKRASKLYSLSAECLSVRSYWNPDDEISMLLTLCLHNNWSHLCFQHFDRDRLAVCLQVLERCTPFLRHVPESDGLSLSIGNAALLNLISSKSSTPAPAA